jgi:predicted aspartyl protease
MDNVTFITDAQGIEHAIIDHGNDQFTSMPKSIYDELKANEAKAI